MLYLICKVYILYALVVYVVLLLIYANFNYINDFFFFILTPYSPKNIQKYGIMLTVPTPALNLLKKIL